MKLKYISIAVITLSLSTLFVSCNDELEEVPFSFISRENFYNTAADAEAAVFAIYAEFTSFDHIDWMSCMMHSSDYGTIHRNATHMAVDSWQLNSEHPFVNDTWNWFYRIINYSNAVIGNVPRIEMEETKQNAIIAEAKFARAYSYFQLVRMFGAIPMHIEEITSPEGTSKAKSTVGEVYSLIEADLADAETNLPPKRTGNEAGRFSSQAAKVLLADVLLTQEKWSEAAQKALEVINAPYHMLLPNFEDVFALSNEKNDELIMYFVSDGAIVSNSMTRFGHIPGAVEFSPHGAQVYQVDQESDIWNLWDSNDTRREFSIYSSFVNGNGDTLRIEDLPRPYPAFSKYRDPVNPNRANSNSDYIMLRYADALLIFAEAHAEAMGGPTAEALEAVNKIRRRAYRQSIDAPSATYDLPLSISLDVFRDSVLWERNKEFVYEKRRTYDLMRKGLFPEILTTVGKTPNLSAKLFPIPQVEIDANLLLGAEDQNPGY